MDALLHIRYISLLRRFTKLRVLSLTSNEFTLLDPSVITDLLSKLTALHRLDLNSFQLSSSLHTILNVLNGPLHVLQLSNCRLEVSDLSNLLRSPHIDTLHELTIAKNDGLLTPDGFDVLLRLLDRLAATVRRLELRAVDMSSDQSARLFQKCTELMKLTYLDVSGNLRIGLTRVDSSLHCWAATPSLRTVRLSKPVNHEQPAADGRLSCRLNRQMDRLCAKFRRPVVNLVLAE